VTPISLRSTALALASAGALLLAACGGSDSSSDTAAPNTTAAADTTTAETTGETMAPDTTGGGSGEFTPGDVEYRVVNLLAEPVDLYVRTQGLVEAFLMEEGVAPGAVTDFYAPPADGIFLVTEAGAGDPECVVSCDHFIAELSPFSDDGLAHTVVLYDNFGQAASFDLWESPSEASSGNANAMAPADAAAGVVVVTAIALTEADFGLRLGIDGVAGCQEAFNLANVLVGGNQTPAFTYEGDSADILLYDNQDGECAGEPVGGPFTIEGGAATRSHLILTGSPGSMDAIVVPMVDGDVVPGESAGADRDDVVAGLAEGLGESLGLTPEQATCSAELIVDEVGLDTFLVDGAVVDFDTLSDEVAEAAIAAMTLAVEACGLDPALLG